MSIVYFIGVTAGKSSIMKVFSEWMKHLGVTAKIRGIGFMPHDEPQRYREVASFIERAGYAVVDNPRRNGA